jgi:hypothetical protein
VMARGGGFNDVWWLESPFFWSEFHGNSDVFLWFYGIFMDIWWDILYIYICISIQLKMVWMWLKMGLYP